MARSRVDLVEGMLSAASGRMSYSTMLTCNVGFVGSGVVAVRVGYVKCEYCSRSQERPQNGSCAGCGAPTPHLEDETFKVE